MDGGRTGVSAGLGASAVGGWEIGKLVNNSQWWQTFIQGKLDKMLGTPDANDPFIGHLVPPIGGVGDWHLELAPQGTTHDQDAWWFVPEPGETVAKLYNGPFEAMIAAGVTSEAGFQGDIFALYLWP